MLEDKIKYKKKKNSNSQKRREASWDKFGTNLEHKT
jgi:hypothetical protein